MHAHTHTHSHCRSNCCVIFAFIMASVSDTCGNVGLRLKLLPGLRLASPRPGQGTEVGCQRSSGRRVWADVLFLFFCCFFLRARSLPAFSATRVTKHFDQNSNRINQKMTMPTCCCCVSECVFFVVCWVWLPSTLQAGKSQ